MGTLEDALRQSDGKGITTLSEIRAAFAGGRTFLSELIGLVGHDETPISDGATWLIKDRLDDGVRLTRSQTEILVGSLHAISSWQAQLHICQSIRHLEISGSLTDDCADWLKPLLRSDRPFLRAWSMDALQWLGSHSPELAGPVEAALTAAEQDSAASVRARARHWRKQTKRR